MAPIAKDYVLYNEKNYEGEVLNARMWNRYDVELVLIIKYFITK